MCLNPVREAIIRTSVTRSFRSAPLVFVSSSPPGECFGLLGLFNIVGEGQYLLLSVTAPRTDQLNNIDRFSTFTLNECDLYPLSIIEEILPRTSLPTSEVKP